MAVRSKSPTTNSDQPKAIEDEEAVDSIHEKQATLTETAIPPVDCRPADQPLSWSQARKTCHQALIVYMAFSCVFTSSVYYPAIAAVDKDFFPVEIAATLSFSVYILGTATGSLFAAPLSETFGRKPLFLGGVSGAALFTLGAGFTRTVAAFSVCRYFAGVFFSAQMAISAAALADMYAPAERAIPLSLCAGVAFLGPAMGPIVGGYVAAKYGWRWTQWLALLFMTPCFLYIFLRESYAPVIAARHAALATKANASPGAPKPSALLVASERILTRTLIRPLAMLAREPVVAAFAAYVGFTFGVNYAFVATYPRILSDAYGLTLQETGFTFAALGAGVLLGTAALLALNRLVYTRRLAAARAAHGPTAVLPPEQRLYGALCGGPCVAAGLFVFGWTARPELTLALPLVAEALFGAGNLLVYSSCSQYLVDHYGAARGASATAANTLVRYVCAFAFPLFVGRVYQALGVPWAGSLLGFVSLALALVPWLLFRFGPRLRREG